MRSCAAYVDCMRVSGTPRCRVTSTGIIIDLRVVRLFARPVSIDISFVEIDELRRMTYIEAASDRAIGANVCKGSVVRPSLLQFIYSTGATLQMRGRDFSYVITLLRDEAEAVVSAYAWFKSREPQLPRDAAAPPSPSATRAA